MKAILAVPSFLGLSLALYLAACSSQNACSDSGGSSGSAGAGGSAGSAGAGGSAGCSTTANAGSGGATTCDELPVVQTCLTAFCQAEGAGTPFCTCYTRGSYDLSAAPDCLCTPLKPALFCAQAAASGVVASDFDCATATSPLTSMCVGVQ